MDSNEIGILGLAVAIISLFFAYRWNKQSEKEHRKIIETVKSNQQEETSKNLKTATPNPNKQTSTAAIILIIEIFFILIFIIVIFNKITSSTDVDNEKKLCNSGFHNVCHSIANDYAENKDYCKAKYYYEKACAGGIAEACNKVKESKCNAKDTLKTPENTFIITGIDFANTDKDNNIVNFYSAEAKFKSSKLKYLSPRITYTSSFSGYKVLYLKIINPDGTIETDSSSPSEYTYKYSLFISPGENQKAKLPGWGNDGGGSYKPGNYIFEIWSEDKKLHTERFYVNGDTPSPPPPASPPPTAETTTIYIGYPGDPYGCLLPIAITIAGQTFIPQGTASFIVNNIPIGQHPYTIDGTITCAYIGSCKAYGSGNIYVQPYRTFAVKWINDGPAKCRIWLE